MVSRYARSRQTRMQDITRDVDFNDEPEIREGLNAEELISAAVAEAKRHVRRNELKTNSALDAISDWIEKSELRRADETKRLASSQERVASAVRDALGLMTGRLNQIESLVAEAPARAFEPIRNALGRLDDRVSIMEEQQSEGERSSLHFSAMMESLGQRLTEVVGKIDELADRSGRDDASLREERIAGIEAKLGSILQQLSRPAFPGESSAPPARPAQALAQAPAYDIAASAPARPRVILRSVTHSGKLDAAVADIRRKQDELGGASPAGASAPGRAEMSLGLASLRTELGALAIQLQRLEKGRLDADTLTELLSTTSEVRRLLADPTMPRLAARLEQSLADLTRRVDALTTKVVDRSEIAALTAAIAEIRAKLSEPRADAGVVERRIEALSAKIDEVMREPLGLVGQHLADLSARLGSSPQSGASNEAISDIRDKLDRIVERSDTPGPNAARPFEGAALAEVRERLDRLNARLDHTPAGVDSGSILDLRERLEQLAVSIEQSASKAPEKIDRALRQIAASVDAARQPDPNPAALQSLERQVSELSQRIAGEAGSAVAISDLERSVMRLFDELAATKAAAIKAAEAASSGAASQALGGDLTIRQEREANEREMHSTLDQMNTTLERIMGRLSSLEEQSRPVATARPAAAVIAPPPAAAADAARLAASGIRPAAPTPEPSAESAEKNLDEIGAFEAAAAEAARGAAARLAQRGATPEAAPAPAVVSHEPLEPGSGRPPPVGTPDANGSGRQYLAGDLSAAVASGGAMSAQALIAAARRAAADTAARQKSASTPASSLGSAKNALSSLKASAGQHRKPILLALIGLMVAFSAIGAGRLILGNDSSGVEQGARPAGPPAPAGGSASGMSGADAGAAKPASPASADPQRPNGASVAPGRSSSLSTPPAPAFTKIGQTAISPDALADVSRRANDVVGSIAAPTPAGSPNAATAAAAMPVPDSATGAEFLVRLKLAANADDPAAEYELAARMYDGRGLPRDLQGAAKLFERAANQGLVPAQYRIANIYETGLGAAKDLVLARAWFEKAADRGNAKAMHNVGVYLAQGIQGKPDYATAVSWFRKAAERNVRDSQYNLAILLARGLGNDRDFKASYVWFALAARDGDGDSAKKRDEIAAHLSSAELDDAKAALASWKPIVTDRAANEVDAKDIKWDRVSSGATQGATQVETAKTSKL
ncbi:localization factor PodJL [Rhizobiales bacterium GAS113]|nr:localization factor PodJL [Rhizobiales bacterium GAS113]